MLELNSHGVLTCSQIMLLIEREHFPEVKVSWTVRDVQNLLQKQCDRKHEAHDFVTLLNSKKSAGWEVSLEHDPESLRLQKIFWVSGKGKDQYLRFHDVLEMDATYKTNRYQSHTILLSRAQRLFRFGMPLVLFTALDNSGITFLIAGCLLSDERYESYKWALEQFHQACKISPKVLFTDGDTEMARAIRDVWQDCVHLLCRFHIAQNITRALAANLRSRLNDFLCDFWRVASIEDMSEYETEFSAIEDKWVEAASYLSVLKAKQTKWAFAFTHSNFVAGVSSTQRQEMINYQVKSSLMSNSSLNRIVDGFDCVEKANAAKILQASLNTKLACITSDPIVNDALKSLTAFAGNILKEECTLSLSYTCIKSQADPGVFFVSHKDHSNKKRTVTVKSDRIETALCSCRKQIWHGIACRHLICVFRHLNQLSCPMTLFNPRWHRDFVSNTVTNTLFNVYMEEGQQNSDKESTTEEQRFAELMPLCKELLRRSCSQSSIFDMVKSTLTAMLNTAIKSSEVCQTDYNGSKGLNNPVKVRTKGRPKTGSKRYISHAEKTQSRRQRKKGKAVLPAEE